MNNGITLYNVVLTSGMGVPVLIGTDVLEANQGVLDYSNNMLVLGKKNKKLYSDRPGRRVSPR